MFGLSKSGKRFLVICAIVFFVAVFLVVLVGARFFIRSKQSSDDGFTFGKGKDQQACVDEALRRHVPTIDPTIQVADSGFIVSCLIVSTPTSDFCNDVPAFSLVNQSPVLDWATERCKEHGFTDRGCIGIFIQVSSFCQFPKEEQKPR